MVNNGKIKIAVVTDRYFTSNHASVVRIKSIVKAIKKSNKFEKYSIAFSNSVSDISSVAHQPAVFLTHAGTFSANAFGIMIVTVKTNTIHRSKTAVLLFNCIIKST